MWIARNKDNSFSISFKPLVTGICNGTCLTDNYGNLVENCWVHSDGSSPDFVYENIFPSLTFEDEPVECSLHLNKTLKVCPKCGRRIWYAIEDIHYDSCEQPSSGYADEWEWIECPECKEKIDI